MRMISATLVFLLSMSQGIAGVGNAPPREPAIRRIMEVLVCRSAEDIATVSPSSSDVPSDESLAEFNGKTTRCTYIDETELSIIGDPVPVRIGSEDLFVVEVVHVFSGGRWFALTGS